MTTTMDIKIVKVTDKRAFLKVKLKSLAAEAKIIRKEEKRNQRLSLELRLHRVYNVRREARLTLLAYAFIRGRTYKSVEATVRQGHEPNWTRVKEMIIKYGRSFDPDIPWKQNEDNFANMLMRFDSWHQA